MNFSFFFFLFFLVLVIAKVARGYDINSINMRSIPAQAKRATNICGGGTNQRSKSRRMSESKMSNYWPIPTFSMSLNSIRHYILVVYFEVFVHQKYKIK